MSYSRSVLLYQDEPEYGRLLKFVILVMPAGLMVASIYLGSAGDTEGSLALLGEALFVSFIFWAVFPRKYQVYDDHLRIMLGGPLAVRIGFERIRTVEVTRRPGLTVNFATKIAGAYVRIVKKKGPGIAITPRSNELFVKNVNEALRLWARDKSIGMPLLQPSRTGG
ncbi:MAG: PH domain-containing protein [Chloroflexi bacterium]|nr:PH domain-containing protein [Chloroflexota bacterium]